MVCTLSPRLRAPDCDAIASPGGVYFPELLLGQVVESLSPVTRRASSVAIVVLLAVISGPMLGCGGGGADPTSAPPATTAALSGTVRETGSQLAIAGATVTTGSVTVTTATNGQFTIASVPIGPVVTLYVSAAGFDAYSQAIAVQAGHNSHDVSLKRNHLYVAANTIIYLTPGIANYHGVILDLPGGSIGDSRPLIRGDLSFYQVFPLYGDVAEYRRRLLAFAEEKQFAVMGVAANTGAGAIVTALALAAEQSGHPELVNAPLLLHGHSLGGCAGYDFTRQHSQRVIAFITQKGPCHSGPDAGSAKSVPAYLIIGERDNPSGLTNITQLFETNRAQGAPWAVAIEPGADHARLGNLNLLFEWMAAVVTLRLPGVVTPGQPVQLRPLDAALGWLGNRATGAIAADAQYSGDKLLASWLPSEQTARSWQALAWRDSISTAAQTKRAGRQ